MDLQCLKSPSCISKEWLSKMLQSHLGGSVTSLDYQIENPENSQGFLSEIAFVKVSFMREGKNRTLGLVFKFMPSQNDLVSFMKSADLGQREVEFYRHAMSKDFQDLLGGQHLVPSIYYSNCQADDLTIVMHNMASLGYELRVVKDGSSLLDTKCALQAVAAIHASGLIYKRNHGNQVPLRPLPVMEEAKEMVAEGLQFLVNWEKSRSYAPIFTQLLGLTEELLALADKAPKLTETVIHGDLWAGQVLFSADSARACIIDWQFAGIGNPVIDLVSFFSMSTDPRLLESNLSELIATYFGALEGVCGDLPFSLVEVEENVESLWMDGFIRLIASLLSFRSAGNITDERLLGFLHFLSKRNVFSKFLEKLP